MPEDKKYQLTVAYRIYPKVSKVPPIYSEDKYKLSELCLFSFKRALGDLKVKVIAILDNCPDKYENLFRKYFHEEDLEIINVTPTGNGGTFKMQVDLLLNQNYSDIIYFAEDDYFYLDGCFSKMLDFINSDHSPDFLTPYDHLDYYLLKLHDYSFETTLNNGQKWRTAATTCMTFMTSKSRLSKTRQIFLTYAQNNYDASLWMTLTKFRLFSPIYYFQMFRESEMYIRVTLKLWWFGWNKIIFGRKYKLYAPVPSLSTHMDSVSLAKDIDWQSEFHKVVEKIS